MDRVRFTSAGTSAEGAEFPRTVAELHDVQRALATASPPPWRPPAGTLAVGAAVIRFPRGGSGAGAAGDPAWAAAAVLREGRVLAEAVVCGLAGAPYAAGVLA